MSMYQIEVFQYARIPIELNREGVREVAIIGESSVEPIIHQALGVAAQSMNLEATLVMMRERQAHDQELTAVMASALLGADLIIGATKTIAMAHTRAGREALRRGIKYVGMPGITVDSLTKGAATADYQEVGQITKKVAQILTAGDEVRVTTEKGTDLILTIKGRKCLELAGIFRPGSIAVFPDGEAPIAPIEGTARGRLVIDSSLHGVGPLSHPVIMMVESGKVKEITGGVEASTILRLLKDLGDANSMNIGEFAVGTNPKARASLNVTEDKKRLGTVHIGLGNNLLLGGRVESRTHMDGVFANPTIEVDGKLIMKKGELEI